MTDFNNYWRRTKQK